MAQFDLVILGGGSGGYACALRASQLGLSVALIEQDKLGGTCLHRGCIPTKALLHAGEIADATRHAGDFGVNAQFHNIDMGGVNSYKDSVVSKLHKGLQGLVKSRNVTYIEGHGRLGSSNEIEVNGERHQGKHIVLPTGSYPKTLPGLEIDGQQIITSEQALNMDFQWHFGELNLNNCRQFFVKKWRNFQSHHDDEEQEKKESPSLFSRSHENLYMNPLQPPPTIPTRKIEAGVGRNIQIFLICKYI